MKIKKSILFLLIITGSSRFYGMELSPKNNSEVHPNLIKCICSDGVEIEIPRERALKSETIQNLLDGVDSTDIQIPLPLHTSTFVKYLFEAFTGHEKVPSLIVNNTEIKNALSYFAMKSYQPIKENKLVDHLLKISLPYMDFQKNNLQESEVEYFFSDQDAIILFSKNGANRIKVVDQATGNVIANVIDSQGLSTDKKILIEGVFYNSKSHQIIVGYHNLIAVDENPEDTFLHKEEKINVIGLDANLGHCLWKKIVNEKINAIKRDNNHLYCLSDKALIKLDLGSLREISKITLNELDSFCSIRDFIVEDDIIFVFYYSRISVFNKQGALLRSINNFVSNACVTADHVASVEQEQGLSNLTLWRRGIDGFMITWNKLEGRQAVKKFDFNGSIKWTDIIHDKIILGFSDCIKILSMAGDIVATMPMGKYDTCQRKFDSAIFSKRECNYDLHRAKTFFSIVNLAPLYSFADALSAIPFESAQLLELLNKAKEENKTLTLTAEQRGALDLLLAHIDENCGQTVMNIISAELKKYINF